MIRQDAIKILRVLKANYPNTYRDYTEEDAEDTIALYMTMFQDSDTELVMVAIKELIGTLKYPPTIAGIKEEMYQLTHSDQSPIELWNIAKEMIGKGLYMTQDEFNTYPEVVRKFFGNTSGLKQIAMLDSQTVNSVTQSNFIKQIAVIQEREKKEEKMLPSTKLRLEKILANTTLKLGD